jgi:diadenosine tetraphosphate (Ap4A) HIT family hydrolase
MFTLDKTLQQDCIVLGEFPLSLLLLMNDRNFPWFILVPKRAGIQEIFQLCSEDQHQLLDESTLLASTLAKLFNADKMNIAALGNVVKQLHVHHVVRYESDPVWPAPIWGKIPAQPYESTAMTALISKVIPSLGNDFTPADK